MKAKLETEWLDKHGVPTEIGDVIVYGLRTKQIAVVTAMKGKMLRVNDLDTEKGTIKKGDRGKTPGLIINLTKIPSIFAALLKTTVGPLRKLTDDQLKSLSEMMSSPDKENNTLAYILLENYKKEFNE